MNSHADQARLVPRMGNHYRTIDLHSHNAGEWAPRRNAVEVDTIVVHYTATQGLQRRVGASGFLRRLDSAVRDGHVDPAEAAALRAEIEASGAAYVPDALSLCLTAAVSKVARGWNYCIASRDAEGEGEGSRLVVVEFVSPELAAHHVGAPTGRTCQRSVGIEVCYPGPAPAGHRGSYEAAAAWFAALGWREMHPVKLPCPDGVKRWFAAIPDTVYGALIELCLGICRAFPIRAVCNHHQFSPRHRIDPDPPISLDLLRERLRDETGREYLARPPRR